VRKQNIIMAGTAVAVCAVIALAALVGVAYERTRPWGRIAPARIETDIRNHLPIGSSRAEIAAYLDKKGIEHSYISENNYARNSNCEVAIIRNTAFNSPVRTDIQIHFNFNRDLRLASYSVKEIYTGP
jgi:hypothetical protein